MTTILICSGFILFDIGTGFVKAAKERNLDSTILHKGLWNKVAEVIALIGCYLLEYAINYIDLGVTIPLLNAVGVYICVMELISILENLGELNEGLKKFFKPYLSKLQDKIGEEDSDGD